MKKICVIMRGLPGSGKSTKVEKLLLKYGGNNLINVFSTDNFFIPITRQILFKNILNVRQLSDTIFELFNENLNNFKINSIRQKFFDLYQKGKFNEAIKLIRDNILEFESFEYNSNYKNEITWYFHEKNFENFKKAVNEGITPIIVDNTNIKLNQFKKYYEYAESNGYEIKIEEPNSDIWKNHRHLLSDFEKNQDELEKLAEMLALKNKHGVTPKILLNMMSNWQDISPDGLKF